MRHSPTHFTLVVVLAGAVALSACSDKDRSATVADAATPANSDSALSATFNDVDVLFAQSMIPHQEQAVEMANDALAPEAAASPKVRRLATRIRESHKPEIELLTALLEEWRHPTEMPGTSGIDGMMSDDDMKSLGTLSGREFDTAWTRMMIENHRSAIVQAATARTDGTNPEVTRLADQIIKLQQADINEMKTLIDN